MKIAAEMTIEIGEGKVPSVIDLLCANSCEIGRMTLTQKTGNVSLYNFNIIYSDSLQFRRVIAFFNDENNECRLVSVKNYFDEMVNGGFITVAGKMKIDNIEDYQMNVLGTGEIIREKIESSDDPRSFSGIGRAAALFSGVIDRSGKTGKRIYHLHSDAELDAAVLQRFTGMNGYPVVARFDLVEDVVKFLKSIEPGFSSMRLEHIDDDDSMAVYDQILQALNIPVISKKYDEIPVCILAAVLKLAAKHRFRLKDCNVGFIGLDVSAIRCAGLLRKAGCMRVLGFDNNEKSMLHFEKESGLATTAENIFSNADIVVLMKNQFTETDLVRMRPGLAVLSMLNDSAAESVVSQRKGCRECVVGDWFDTAILYPGMLAGASGSERTGFGDDVILSLAEMLANEEAGGGRFFPDIFSGIHDRVSGCINGK